MFVFVFVFIERGVEGYYSVLVVYFFVWGGVLASPQTYFVMFYNIINLLSKLNNNPQTSSNVNIFFQLLALTKHYCTLLEDDTIFW